MKNPIKQYILSVIDERIDERINKIAQKVDSNREFLEDLVTSENRLSDDIYQKIVRVVEDYFPLEVRNAGGTRKVISEASGKKWKELIKTLNK